MAGLLPPPAPGLPYLIVALHTIDGLWLMLVIIHILVRLGKRQLALFKVRRNASGNVYVPQARSIITLFAVLSGILEQINLAAVTKAMVNGEASWVVAFNALLNYTWIPLALGAWTLAWAGLTHLLISRARGPSAPVINVTCAAIPLLFLIVLIPLFSESQSHLYNAVGANLAGDTTTEMSEFAAYQRNQRAAVSWVAAAELIFLAVYIPCSTFYVREYARLYRQQARINDEEPGVYVGPDTAKIKIPLSEIKWSQDPRFLMLFLEMILVVFGLLCDIATLIWFAGVGAFITDPIAFAGFLGMLHLSTTTSGMFIAMLATARLLIPAPFSRKTWQSPDAKDTPEPRSIEGVQAIAFSGLIEEKIASKAAETFKSLLPGESGFSADTADTGADTTDTTTYTHSEASPTVGQASDQSWLDMHATAPPPNSEAS